MDELEVIVAKVQEEDGVSKAAAARKVRKAAEAFSHIENMNERLRKIERQSAEDPVLAFLNSIETEDGFYASISVEDYEKLLVIVEKTGHSIHYPKGNYRSGGTAGTRGSEHEGLDNGRVYFTNRRFETTHKGHMYTYYPELKKWDRYGNK